VQVARGAIALNGQALTAGDGAAIEASVGDDLDRITLTGAANEAEVLLFDMAA
jgi:redox-sensitive bicupin YhaK (pirin superfamily)